MDEFKGFVAEVASWMLACLLQVTWVALGMALVMAWCLFVFVLTGRFPWFVRKYF